MGRLNLNKKSKRNLGQSIAEYFLIMVVILAAIFSTRFIDRLRTVFIGYRDVAVFRMR